MKNENAFIGMVLGAGVGFVLGMLLDQQQKMNLKNKK